MPTCHGQQHAAAYHGFLLAGLPALGNYDAAYQQQ